jgi:hypothetical protein
LARSPVVSLRRLQEVVRKTTGADVPSLTLADALLDLMPSNSFRFERPSLESYRENLRNWQIADEIILANVSASLSVPRRGPVTCKMDIPVLYAAYVVKAELDGIVPFALTTFRIHAYAIAMPFVSAARRREPIRA